MSAAASRGGSRIAAASTTASNTPTNTPTNATASRSSATRGGRGRGAASSSSGRQAAWKSLVRRFEPPISPPTSGSAGRFKTMTYNLLANSLLDPADVDFRHIPPDVVAWRSRQKRLQNQILRENADLACLQELDADCVDEFMRPFVAANFAHRFKSRTGANRDGCALLWKTSVFDLLAYRDIEFKHMAGVDGVPLPFMDRDNVAQVAALRHRASGRVLVVGNCHLLFNQSRGEIKLAQLVGLFRLVAEFKALYASDGAPPPAVLIGGDFNSTPVSNIYHFIASGVLDLRDADTRLLSGQQLRAPPPQWASGSDGRKHVMKKPAEIRHIMQIAAQCFGAAPILPASSPSPVEEPAEKKPKLGDEAKPREEEDAHDDEDEHDDDGVAQPSRQDSDNEDVAPQSQDVVDSVDWQMVLHHTLQLSSVYPRKSELSRRSATCMRRRFVDQKWVDYIFTSPQLRALSVLAVPSDCRAHISPYGLPTRTHPSDHLPLCAVVEFADAPQPKPPAES